MTDLRQLRLKLHPQIDFCELVGMVGVAMLIGFWVVVGRS
jgi:hypothetical protein